MTIDETVPSFDYTLVKNGELLADDSASTHELRFDSENLSSRLPSPKRSTFRMMPFMETFGLAKDPEKNSEAFGRRFSAIRTGWPVVEKMIVHEENGNLKLFRQSLRELGGKRVVSTKLEMSFMLIAVIEQIGAEFALDDGIAQKRIYELLKKASIQKAFAAALAHYRADGRLDAIWLELTSIRKKWHKVYFIVAPIYWSFGWDPAQSSLDDYTLCQKRFDELRTFYVDCFETFCRLAVIAAGLEGVAELDQFVIPFPGSPRPVTGLENMANGNKHTLLTPLIHGDIFVPFIDSKLRNGVGHNAAHYDVTVDTIGYRNQSPSRGVEEFDVSYIRFCEKIVRLYGQLEACAPLAHFLRIKDKESSGS